MHLCQMNAVLLTKEVESVSLPCGLGKAFDLLWGIKRGRSDDVSVPSLAVKCLEELDLLLLLCHCCD